MFAMVLDVRVMLCSVTLGSSGGECGVGRCRILWQADADAIRALYKSLATCKYPQILEKFEAGWQICNAVQRIIKKALVFRRRSVDLLPCSLTES